MAVRTNIFCEDANPLHHMLEEHHSKNQTQIIDGIPHNYVLLQLFEQQAHMTHTYRLYVQKSMYQITLSCTAVQN